MKAMIKKKVALALLLSVMGYGGAQWIRSGHVAFAGSQLTPWFVPHTTVIAAPAGFKSVAVVNESAPKDRIPAQWEWVERGKTVRLTWVDEGREDVGTPSYGAVFSRQAGKVKPTGGVSLSKLTDRIEVKINGQIFTGYYFKTNSPKPFLHPFKAASGTVVTRGFPVERGITGEPLEFRSEELCNQEPSMQSSDIQLWLL